MSSTLLHSINIPPGSWRARTTQTHTRCFCSYRLHIRVWSCLLTIDSSRQSVYFQAVQEPEEQQPCRQRAGRGAQHLEPIIWKESSASIGVSVLSKLEAADRRRRGGARARALTVLSGNPRSVVQTRPKTGGFSQPGSDQGVRKCMESPATKASRLN